MSNCYVIGLGSSHLRAEHYLKEAENALRGHGDWHVCSMSRVMKSVGAGTKDPLMFQNQAAVIQTVLHPSILWFVLRRLETQLGRIRTSKNAPRTIDLDVLWWSNGSYRDAWVTIPHPELYRRKFALDLAEDAMQKSKFRWRI